MIAHALPAAPFRPAVVAPCASSGGLLGGLLAGPPLLDAELILNLSQDILAESPGSLGLRCGPPRASIEKFKPRAKPDGTGDAHVAHRGHPLDGPAC